MVWRCRPFVLVINLKKPNIVIAAVIAMTIPVTTSTPKIMYSAYKRIRFLCASTKNISSRFSGLHDLRLCAYYHVPTLNHGSYIRKIWVYAKGYVLAKGLSFPDYTSESCLHKNGIVLVNNMSGHNLYG
jgi:hypothetical protein